MKTRYLLLAALSLTLLGCTRDNTPTSGEIARDYLALWMDKYHPGISANSDGLYILKDEPGTGDLWDSEQSYSYVEVTVRTLNGTISSTSDSTLCKQLGTYAKGNYYGPRFQATGEGSSYAGFDAMLKGMRSGGTREAVIPAWMLTTSRFDTQQKYLDAATSSTSLIYGVTLRGQTNDVTETEKDSLYSYVQRKYGNVLSSSYKSDTDPDGTFYFISDTSAFVNSDINLTGGTDDGENVEGCKCFIPVVSKYDSPFVIEKVILNFGNEIPIIIENIGQEFKGKGNHDLNLTIDAKLNKSIYTHKKYSMVKGTIYYKAVKGNESSAYRIYNNKITTAW